MYAVDHLNMTVPQGAIYGFIGENGSGKSTTEKLICGHLVPDGGDIKLFGRDYRDPGVRVRVGALIENAGCFPGSSVYQNLMMQCINLGIENADEEIRRVLEIVRMEDNANLKFKSCSLGMKQRIGIAMALFGEKYGDTVRVVKIGKSIELCGGTHASNTNEISRLAITSCESKGSNVYRIALYAFRDCSGLTSCTILGNTLEEIQTDAFRGCTSLTSIDIPSSIKEINSSAFYNCTSLNSITVRATIPPKNVNKWTFAKTNNCPIYVPSGTVSTYKKASGWSEYADRIQPIQ